MGLSREIAWEFERLGEEEPFFHCYNHIKDAQYKLEAALRMSAEERTLPHRQRAGARGLEELQDIVRSVAFGWKELT